MRAPRRRCRSRSSFARRNRIAVGAAFAIALALLLGAGLALVQARRANEQAQIARSERDRAERVTEFLTGMLAAADPATGGREVNVVSLLDAAASGLEQAQGGDAEVTAAIQRTLAQSYRALGLLDPALANAEAAFKRVSAGPANARAAALVLGEIRLVRGGAMVTAPAADRCPHGLRRGPGQRAGARRGRQSARRVAFAGRALCAGRTPLCRRHRQRARKASRANAPRLAELLDNLAVARGRAGKLADAEDLHTQSLAIFRAAHGERHPHTAHALFNLANVREMRDDFAGADSAYRQAEDIQRQVLGDTHPDLAQTLASHTFMLNRAGRTADALQRGREAVAAADALTPPNPIAAYAHAMYGEALLNADQAAAAELELRDAMTQRERMLPADHPVRLNSESLLGAALVASGEAESGVQRMRHAAERLLAHARRRA